MKPIFKQVNQIGIVVKNLDEVVRTFADKFGIGPWSIWEFNSESVEDMVINDEKINHRMLEAVCYIGELSIKVIEPLDDICVYAEFLKNHGEGLHHISYKVDNFNEVVEFFKNMGLKIYQGGNWYGKSTYAYFDLKELKHIVKISQSEPGFFKFESNQTGRKWITYPIPQRIYPSIEKIGSMVNPVLEEIIQVAFVVKNIDEIIRVYNDKYGIGPWQIWELDSGNVENMQINGKNIAHEMRSAASTIGNTVVELIQPKDIKTIHAEFLKTYGEGFHHVAYKINNFEEAMERLNKLGIEVCQSGNWYGRFLYIYLNTDHELKHITEIYKRDPDFLFPDPLEVYPKFN